LQLSLELPLSSMKVVLWSTSYLKGFGGAERIVHEIAHRLAERGDQVAVVADRTGVETEWSNRCFGALPPSVAVVGVGLPNPLRQPWRRRPWFLLRYLRGAFEAERFLRRERPDIVHLHLVNVDVLLLALLRRLLGFRLVLTLTGGEPVLAASSVLSRLKLRVAFHDADAVTCVSSDLERWAAAWGVRGVRRIPNGVDTAELRRETDRAGTIESRQDYLVFCGRLAAVKRLDLLLSAFCDSVRRGSTLRLVLIGDGELGGWLADQVRRSGLGDRIEHRGALAHEAAMAVLAGARGLVLSSASEACPLVLLEAMALGRAVIAPDIGGVRDLVIDGATGLLFPAGCSERLAERMLDLARSPALAAELGRRGAERVRDCFGSAAMMGSYLEVYRTVARPPSV
jgi:glycosyltransferase involved in cell wall biosynthesis